MNKQQLIEELTNYMTNAYNDTHDNNNESIDIPLPQSCNLCDSLKDIIESIAYDEKEIGKLIETQADKLKCTVTSTQDLVFANKSIGDILDRLIIFEGFSILKLKAACTCEKYGKK